MLGTTEITAFIIPVFIHISGWLFCYFYISINGFELIHKSEVKKWLDELGLINQKKMEAKNFRIGNLVEEPKGCTHKIERVDILSKRVRHGLKISIPHLTGFGFVKDDNGNYWMDLQTHYIELTPSNGYWCPIYAQLPEMSHEDEQRVSINRIQFIHELQNLFFALTGTELEMKIDRSICR